MDNTNGGENGNDMQFFTAGAGVPEESLNTNPKDENLDLSNWMPETSAPKAPETPEIPTAKNQEISKSALSTTSEQPDNLQEEPDSEAKLGKVVDLMPPDASAEEKEHDESDKDTDLLIDGKLTENEVKIIKQHENKLAKDGNIIDFYDYISRVRQKAVGEKAA